MLFGGRPPLETDERHVVLVRSHAWTPIRAALPVPLIALLPIPYAILDYLAPDLRLSAVSDAFLLIVAVAAALYLLKWFFVDFLPWTQRVYVVTNRRIIAQSGVLSVQRREFPLTKVQESDYVSSGVVSRLLDVGDVEVQTLGQMGTVVLRSVAHPRRLQGLISAEVRAAREEETRRRLSETPREVLRQLETVIYGAPTPAQALTEVVRPITKRATRAQRRLNLLPDEAVVDVVRQHPLVMAIGLLAPLIALLIVIVAAVALGPAFLPFALAIVVLILAPWAVWRILEHHAHEYVLTTERLMELRSLPLLFEMRNVVQLAAVQDVTLEIPSLLGRLAGIGDVVVEVAGPNERIVLKTVARPDEVQKLVFEMIDAQRRHQREREDQRLVSTLSQWFEQYHKLQQGQQGGGNPP